MKKTILRTGLFMMISMAALSIDSSAQTATTPAATEWVAPKTASEVKNPMAGKATAAAEGKKTFTTMCVVCHGEKGDGAGLAGVNLKPKPANFTSAKVQSQTDGALFWKMSEGKGAMAPYKNILTADQRWQLVSYIRTFKKK